MGAYRGFEEAAKKLGWRIQLKDGGGSKAVQATQLAFALGARPDGIVIGGFDPGDFSGEMAQAKKARIALVGWHAAKEPGPTGELFANISTRPLDVAQLAADFVIQDAKRKGRTVGVVIFNDRQFAVANAKTAAMKQSIEACRNYRGCKVLAVEDIAISDVATRIPPVVSRLVATHGASWTYSLAINDIYFDEINYPLIAAQRTDIVNVSAGDGSNKALGRIAAGLAQQAATVAEPLRLQGFQLADELNRAFAGSPPSGFEAKPILVTTESLKKVDQGGIEAKLGFEAAYSAIWGTQ
ncbi:MAG: hypothetical protein D3M94_16380 [Rhodocyclales bacterium GT-UBC]|nr:MAG: hypothetical protein D3M94_16380 [Rhodocyclales bacterium GT-UBC]